MVVLASATSPEQLSEEREERDIESCITEHFHSHKENTKESDMYSLKNIHTP